MSAEIPEQRHEHLRRVLEFTKLGFAGILRDGRIVDRREHPEATPIPRNPFLGVPEPAELHLSQPSA